MRPPAIEKLGYYPTSVANYTALASWFLPTPEDQPGRLLDNCCGEGSAAGALARALNCTSLGVELSPQRAAIATTNMDWVHNAAWQAVSLTPETITFLFLNPPYHHDRFGEHKRLELEFLKTSTPKLIKGGILVYIVPLPLLAVPEVAAHLAGYYENFTVRRYLETVFNQVIIIATKKQKYKMPSQEEINAVRAWAETEPPMLAESGNPGYELLPAPDKGQGGQPFRFTRLDWEPEEIVDATMLKGVHQTKEWLDLINPSRAIGQFKQPVMPLKKGHVAMLMASGMMGVIKLRDENGHPMLVKGRVVKTVVKVEETASKDGKTITERYRDRFETTVAVTRQGGVETISEVTKLSEFMMKFGDQLGSHILSTYRPLYNFDPTPQEVATLDEISAHMAKNVKPLPGQAKAGLLPAQRHAATALARALKKYGVANAQMEMGVGKTRLSISAAAVVAQAISATLAVAGETVRLAKGYPAIILSDPHMCPKWAREIEETIPGAKAMELSKIGKSSDGPGDVNDVENFISLAKSGKLGPKPFAVIAHSTAKLSSGWGHRYKVRIVTDEDNPTLGSDLAQLKTFFANTSRPMQRISEMVVASKKDGAGDIPGFIVRNIALCCLDCGKPIEVEEKKIRFIARSLKALGDKRLFCEGEVPGYEIGADGLLKRDSEGNPVWGKRTCGAPLFSFDEGRRVSVAEYIATHAKGEFKTLICDEVHKFRGKSTDRGVAFHQLVSSVKYVLTLTGTLFGGKSTSIFWLLHRLNAGVRKDFSFDDEKRWANLYGVLEGTRQRRSDEDADEDGDTGNRRYINKATEKPGVSPAIINRLLETTVFMSLKDLGLALPPYSEEVVQFDMLDEQEEQYSAMAGTLRRMALRDRRVLSTWLQWTLARPNSGFRDEVVKFTDRSENEQGVEKEIIELPAIDTSRLPKEQWLADFCKSERAQGRKVLIYVRQTATRDIQPRVEAVLKQSGIRAITLNGNIDPRKREAWINSRVGGIDALITNPKLVETGLDLVQFASVVFFEIDYSLVRRMAA